MKRKALVLLAGLTCMLSGCSGIGSSNTLVNVSYDPTRELYEAYNELFTAYWEEETGETIRIIQSHGGSGKQALEVANGLPADVVTLALEGDVDSIRDAELIDPGYVEEFPSDSAPYTSSIVFLVRAGNPKEINDWSDLLREDVGVITPNPKTSGGARWNYLAAWYSFEREGLSEEEIIEAMRSLYQNVVVLDSGARGSTTSFVENGQGDVLIAWENEAFLSLEERPGEFEIVIPSASILCQPTVAVVDAVVYEHSTEETAAAYLNYLYSEEAQKLIGENFYRPVDQETALQFTRKGSERTLTEIPEDGRWLVDTVDLTDITYFGGWDAANEKHFTDGALFDQLYE
ncbi:MAG: sulfate ABC transporter substrate-binding protein [Lachnospiraceae bacterium]|nr:sulfate ABC transporter substrate-binding protein [Lachnospiraceae bacterium]